jgi:hypothetical protein
MELQRGLWSSLQNAIDGHRIELFEEYLEIHRLPVGGEEPSMLAYLDSRYGSMQPDVVVLVGPQALAFSNEWMTDVFPEALQIFAGVREHELASLGAPTVNGGVLYELPVEPLLNVALQLLPDTQSVLLVGGSAPFDQRLIEEVRTIINGKFALQVTEISGLLPSV